MKIDNSFFSDSLLNLNPQSGIIAGDESTNEESIFKTIFSDMLATQSEASYESKEKTAELLTGSLDDMSELLVSGEKSGILFDLNLAVRNKVLDAFNEIMRTQV